MKSKTVFNCFAAIVILLLALAPVVRAAAAPLASEKEQEVSPGENLLISQGNCGALLVNIPEEGELTIKSGVTPERKGIQLYKHACKLSYKGEKDQDIAVYPGYMSYFINLDSEARMLWDQGELAFYTFSGGKWSTCSAYLVSGGDHGRLVCPAQTINMFGIGTVHEEAEEAAKEHVKAVEGEPIEAYGNLAVSAGRCSADIIIAPQAGYVDIENGCTADCTKGLKFIHDVCKLSYTDSEEKAIPLTRGYVTYAIRLVAEEKSYWEAGNLAFYIKSGNTWQECSARWIPIGNHGTLLCTAQTVGGFGLVDIKEKAEEEED
jgi:hypothetical protein